MESESTSPKQKPVTLSFPPDLIGRLDAAAAAEDRSRSKITARALRAYLDQHPDRPTPDQDTAS
jgi:metal-responsive CopG/Arc/MetJ family transcriptional regulator